MTKKASEAALLSRESTLESLRAYRQSDPNFERAVADYVDAESSLQEDPAEGQRADIPSGAVRLPD
jgi:hypothetical protein